MFPHFETLCQYERSECAEFLDLPYKTLLLMLDDEYFPFLLDWAQTEGISNAILFLLEADALRFNHATSPRQPRLHRLINSFFDIPHAPSDAVAIRHMHEVYEDISSHRIPLNCLLSMACDIAWKSLIIKSQSLPQSNVWPSIRRSVVGDYRIELFNVLTDDYSIKYYEKFVSRNVGDSGSLKCWQQVRHVLQTLQIFKASNAPQPTITPTRGRHGSVILRTASIGSTSSGHNGEAAIYAMPYDALNILLDCLRQMHQYILRHNCNGPSDVCRLDLAALVETTNPIRNVEVLDLKYVNEVIASAEKTIRTIERETFQHLQQGYDAFLSSNEFVEFVAEYRIQRSDQVQNYVRRVAFLEEVDRGRYFHWKDTGDVLYTSYRSSMLGGAKKFPPIIALHVSEAEDKSPHNSLQALDSAAGKLFQAVSDEEQNDGPTCHHCWLYENYANKTMSLCAHSAPASIINALVDACCMIGWGSHWMDISESASPTSLCVSADDNDGCTMFASSDQELNRLINRLIHGEGQQMPCAKMLYFCLTRNTALRKARFCNLVISPHPLLETIRCVSFGLKYVNGDISVTVSSPALTSPSCTHSRDEHLSDIYFGDDADTVKPLCDFSVTSVLRSVSPMLIMRIMLSILARRTVVIFSLSPILTCYVMASIHALLYPFLIDHVDVVHCFSPESLNAAMLNTFINSNDKCNVYQRPLLMGLRSDLAKLLILKREKNATTHTNMFDVEEVENSISLSVSSHHVAHTRRAHTLRERDMMNMRAMEEHMPTNGEALFQHAYFFDIDAEMVWYENSWVESSSCGWTVSELLPKDQLQFLITTKTCLDNCRLHDNSHDKVHQSTSIFPLCVDATKCNHAVQKCFHRLWTRVILRGIPPALVHYPKQKVIGINAETLIMLFHSSQENQQDDTTNSVHMRCHVDFVMAMFDSPVFVDLIKRHGYILNPFV